MQSNYLSCTVVPRRLWIIQWCVICFAMAFTTMTRTNRAEFNFGWIPNDPNLGWPLKSSPSLLCSYGNPQFWETDSWKNYILGNSRFIIGLVGQFRGYPWMPPDLMVTKNDLWKIILAGDLLHHRAGPGSGGRHHALWGSRQAGVAKGGRHGKFMAPTDVFYLGKL